MSAHFLQTRDLTDDVRVVQFMITMVCLLLLSGVMGSSTGVFSFLGLFFCCLPFFLDLLISLRATYVRVFDVPERPQACTVTELTPSNEENFLSADDCSSTRAATSASMHNPSERLVPSALA